MLNKIIKILAGFTLCSILSAGMCTKVAVYGTDNYTIALSRDYSASTSSALEAGRKILENMGYQVLSTDESRNRITTGWRPVESDSHYMLLFNRRDYASTEGAYYQLIMDVSDANPTVRVSISTTVKSIAGKLKSGHVVERKILDQLDNQLRSPQIEMTNVEVKNR